MTIPERMYALLTEHKPSCFCDDCIQKRLCLPRRQQVAPITKTLGLTLGFRRERGLCCECPRPSTKFATGAR